jgi:hypothetical protein
LLIPNPAPAYCRVSADPKLYQWLDEKILEPVRRGKGQSEEPPGHHFEVKLEHARQHLIRVECFVFSVNHLLKIRKNSNKFPRILLDSLVSK